MTDEAQHPTPEELQAIDIARSMAAAGIPIFVAPPRLDKPGRYFFPGRWEQTVADPAVLDQWKPGWGIGAVGGGAADFLDVDPRNGGEESQRILKNAGQWPLTFGTASTPSGGTHEIISRTGERKETGFMPGIDFQAGADTPDERGSHGRAFVWLAPTRGVSKVTGELVPYRWVVPPDLEALDEWRAPDGSSTDASTEGVVARVHAHRALKGAHSDVRSSTQPSSEGVRSGESQLFGGGWQAVEERVFTPEQARAFTEPALQALRDAPIGVIEERGMAATLALEHFVPAFLSSQQAYAVVCEALSHTAYDPNGPSDWTADKFLARLDGRRPVDGSWKAVRAPEPASLEQLQQVAEQVHADAVEALLAEMLTPGQLKERPRKAYLVKGLLHLDSEAWLIGAPGSRKSFVALDMAGHIAAGREWQGRKVRQASVVIIAAEGAGGMGDRVRAWELEHGQMPDCVHILPRPVQSADSGAWMTLVRACERLQPGLVIADTQARITVGLEENSATDMGIFINALSALRMATGACVMAVHHTGRSGGDARGSSALDGAQDTELKVVALGQPLRGELRTEKQKDLMEGEPIPLLFKLHTVGVDDDGDPVTSLALAGQDAWRNAETAPVEQEPWEIGHAQVIVELFKVLRDQGSHAGLTKSEARQAVLERFYRDDPKALTKSTWYSGWDRAREKTASNGDPVMVSAGGQRWTLDPDALAAMGPRNAATSLGQ
jgi:hypothetical protein